MDTTKDIEPTQPLDSQTEALRSIIGSLLDEKLQPIRADLIGLKTQIVRIEDDSKARYVDLRAHLAKMQASLDLLNSKFDVQADEVKFLRKSVRELEDRADAITV